MLLALAAQWFFVVNAVSVKGLDSPDSNVASKVVPDTGGTAALSWIPPTTNTDGSVLTDLAGYRVHWGLVPGNWVNYALVDGAMISQYTVTLPAVTTPPPGATIPPVLAPTSFACVPAQCIAPPPALVSQLSPATYRLGTLAVGAPAYVDRPYTWTDVATFGGSAYVLTANDDKTLPVSVSFVAGAPVTVYVLHDVRAPVPAWLSSWTLTQTVVRVTDGADGTSRRVLRKDFAAGTVTLGPNATGTTANMFSAVVVAR